MGSPHIIGKAANLGRLDTTIEGIVALHFRCLVPGAPIDSKAGTFSILVNCPEGYQNMYLMSQQELNQFAQCGGYVHEDLVDKPVRAYYLGKQLVGLEPLDIAKQ